MFLPELTDRLRRSSRSGVPAVCRAGWVLSLVVLSGCASLPRLDPPPATSHALPLSSQTSLGRLALASMRALEADGT